MVVGRSSFLSLSSFQMERGYIRVGLVTSSDGMGYPNDCCAMVLPHGMAAMYLFERPQSLLLSWHCASVMAPHLPSCILCVTTNTLVGYGWHRDFTLHSLHCILQRLVH
jgi:hypothetical protein